MNMKNHKKIIFSLSIFIVLLNIMPLILTFLTDNIDYLGIFNILGFLFLLLLTNLKSGSLIKIKSKNQKVLKKEEVNIFCFFSFLQLLITILCISYIY